MWTNKDKYIFSKAYPDDFSSIEINDGVLNLEGFCAVKSLLRVAKTKKKENLVYFINKYPALLDAFEVLLCQMPVKHNFSLFVNSIKGKRYEKACDYAATSLEEVKKINSYFYKPSKRTDSYFINDYFKIVNSSAFRRLQDKSQLYIDEDEDFPRKRLTHSIEVSAIGERIASKCEIEKYIVKFVNKELYFGKSNCSAILRSAGALHDIGNPPFGHSGERCISKFFEKPEIVNVLQEYGINTDSEYYKDICLFDGNAQSLRIASKLMSFDNKEGASLTAGVYASIIKYPFGSDSAKANKVGYFITEKDLIDDLRHFGVYIDDVRNPFASILELADDLAYLVSDLEDGIHKREISYTSLCECLNKYKGDVHVDDFISKLTSRFKEERLKHNEEYIVFTNVVRPLLYKFRENIVSTSNLIMIDDNGGTTSIFKYIVDHGSNSHFSIIEYSEYYNLFLALGDAKHKLIKESKLIKKSEEKGDDILNSLLHAYFYAVIFSNVDWDNHRFVSTNNMQATLDRISNNFVEIFFKHFPKSKKNDRTIVTYYKMRLLIDQISGMTDEYAKSEYDLLNINKKPSHLNNPSE